MVVSLYRDLTDKAFSLQMEYFLFVNSEDRFSSTACFGIKRIFEERCHLKQQTFLKKVCVFSNYTPDNPFIVMGRCFQTDFKRAREDTCKNEEEFYL